MHCSATALETTVVVERLNHSSKTEELHVREEVREREKGEGQSEREKGERGRCMAFIVRIKISGRD